MVWEGQTSVSLLQSLVDQCNMLREAFLAGDILERSTFEVVVRTFPSPTIFLKKNASILLTEVS